MAKAMSDNMLRAFQKQHKNTHNKGRKVATRRIHLNYLIVCEGERTEPNYFKALVGGRNSKVIDLRAIGKGQGTCKLVKAAISERDKSPIEYDRVWTVFDKDDFTDFNEAITMAEANNIGAAWSNESFELWYYLYFQYVDTPISRTQYIDALNREIRKYIPNYAYHKEDENTLSILNQFGNLEQAILRAKKLESRFSNKNYATYNPCTKVHHLVQELLNPEEVLDKMNVE